MAFDAHKNFAYSTVYSAPSPSQSGTTLTVQSGEGTDFPDPPFNATVWPINEKPRKASAEVIRVTGKTGDIFTILRAQEGTTARKIVAGDQIAVAITAKALTDIEESTAVSNQVLVQTKVVLEGAWNGQQMTTSLTLPTSQPYNRPPWNYLGSESVVSMPSGITDWVLLELRRLDSTITASRAALLKQNGSVVDLDGTSPVKFEGITPGKYFIVIYHRNHLAVMSATAITLTAASSQLYDFTTGLAQAFGNGMKSVAGTYAMIAGDVDHSGRVNVADSDSVFANLNITGYDDNDVNMSGIVSAADANLALANLNLTTQVPLGRPSTPHTIAVTEQTTIQAAINSAKAGDTILVYPGTYAPFTTKKGVSVVGIDRDTCIVDVNWDPNVYVTTDSFYALKSIVDNALVSNLTLRTSNTNSEDTTNVTGAVVLGTKVLLRNVKIVSNAGPCAKQASGTWKIFDCEITNLDDNSNSHGIVKSGGTMILKGTPIYILNTSAKSIYAASAQTVKIYGQIVTNQDIHANVSIAIGDLIVDSLVQA